MEENYLDRMEELDDLYFGKMGMCGCGRPNDVKKLIHYLIDNQEKRGRDEISFEEMQSNRMSIIRETDSDVIFEFVFHYLNDKGIMEHGNSVYGSWLTPKGKRFFELLSEDVSE